MYRSFLLVLVSTHAALGAPQESRDSSITYLNIQSSTDKPLDNPNYRSYGFVPKSAKKSSKTQSDPVISDDNQKYPDNPPESDTKITKPSDTYESNATDIPYVNTSGQENSADNQPVPDSYLSNQNESKINHDELDISKEETSIKKNNTDSPTIEKSEEHKNLLKDVFENFDNDPLESSQDRHSRDYDYTTATYESSETEIADYSTERYDNSDDTKSSKKISPKLTYFQKFGGSFSHNLIESSGKRRFRSRCRCEKIWNCPKLQITVPRCPEEYFMCCF